MYHLCFTVGALPDLKPDTLPWAHGGGHVACRLCGRAKACERLTGARASAEGIRTHCVACILKRCLFYSVKQEWLPGPCLRIRADVSQSQHCGHSCGD